MFDRNAEVLGKEARKAENVGSTLARLLRYFRPYTGLLAVIFLFVIINVLIQVAVPLLIGQTVDCALVEQLESSAASCRIVDDVPADAAGRLRLLGILVSVAVGGYLVGSLCASQMFFLFAKVGYRILHQLRMDVFQHIHRLSLGYFTRNSSGDVMSRVTNDISTIQQIVGFPFLSTIQGILLITLIITAMLVTNWVFALVAMSMLPLMFIATRWLSTLARQAFRVVREEVGEINADLQENIAAVREVQAFNREEENIAQFRAQNKANRDANVRAQAFSSALAPTLEALGFINVALVILFGGWVVVRNGGTLFGAAVSAGLIITFVQYSQQFNFPVQQIATLWANIQSAIAGSERIFELLDATPDVVDAPHAIEMPHIEGHVQLNEVHAQYVENEPVLRGMTMEARPGETIAIVGPTGAGKTTILNLIPRFWDVTAGSVLIDGHDVRDVTSNSLRNQIGIVLQDTFLFSDTVRNNIRFSRPDATDAEVEAAAKLARADQFIDRLPEGYDTVLGERGTGLSQGQRQLLSIARVALSDPRILILDEATSSVDTRTERQIQVALDQLLAGRTSFVVAHRLSTIRNADQVIVLDAGKIVERGTHDSLLAEEGMYYDLYMSQFRRNEEIGVVSAG